MSEFRLLLQDYRLTTAEIFYHMPDFPTLLQSYVWQEYDMAPGFPQLKRFLDFWERELDGRLHSVKIASVELITPGKCQYAKGEIYIH